MMTYETYRELQRHLLDVSRLIQLYDEMDTFFVPETNHWLKRTEDILQKAGISTVSEIAALRGQLLSSERGYRNPGIVTPQPGRRESQRRARKAVAVQALDGAQKTVHGILEAYGVKLDEAEQLVKKLFTGAAQLGMLNKYLNNAYEAEKSLPALFKEMLGTEPLYPYAARTMELLNLPDIVKVMDRRVLELVALNNNSV